MVDVLWLTIGLVAGGAAVAVVLDVMGRGKKTPPPMSKLTSNWRLSDLRRPVVVARDVLDIDVPSDAHVFASGIVDAVVQKTATVRHVPPVSGEYALDEEGQRALLFLGGVRKGALAMMTVDPIVVQRLETESRMLRDRSSVYLERHRIEDLAGRHGAAIETQGTVRDIVPFHDRTMLRLEDDGHIIGVMVDTADQALVGQAVTVRGRLDRDRTGYPVVEAKEISRL